MKRHLTLAFWLETVLASMTAFLVILTAVWHDWIEGILGFDPDHHDGMFEWELVVVCLLTVLCAWLARREWRKAAPESSAGASLS